MGLAKELRQRRNIKAKEVIVPEWGDESGAFKLYCNPITCKDLAVLQKKHPDFLSNTSITAMVDLIIIKAVDADGKRLFSGMEDRDELMQEDTTVISEIATQMFTDIESQEDVEKN